MSKGSNTHLSVTQHQDQQRLDNFLFVRMAHIPKTRIYRAIRSGEVRVNKGRVKPFVKLAEGDSVRVPPLWLEELSQSGRKMVSGSGNVNQLNAMIAYEDDALILINKPAGLAVHGGSGLAYGVIELIRSVRPKHDYYELVHRLDKETSGCLLVAKKRSALRAVQALFVQGRVQKQYIAVVQGHWPSSLTKIDAPLAKQVLQSGERMAVVDQASGKSSQTIFEVLRCGDSSTCLKVTPKTGRMHQIRVHCAAAGHPILGDKKYGDAFSSSSEGAKASHHAKRMALHAERLRFSMPDFEKDYDFYIPYDRYFDSL